MGVREVNIDDGDNDNAVVQKCADVRNDNDDKNKATDKFDDDKCGTAIVLDGIGVAKTNESKGDKMQACGEMTSENGDSNLPIEVQQNGLSAKRIRLIDREKINNVEYETNAACKNFVLLIATIVEMMQKIESLTWWWFDGMMKFDSETNFSSCSKYVLL